MAVYLDLFHFSQLPIILTIVWIWSFFYHFLVCGRNNNNDYYPNYHLNNKQHLLTLILCQILSALQILIHDVCYPSR